MKFNSNELLTLLNLGDPSITPISKVTQPECCNGSLSCKGKLQCLQNKDRLSWYS